MLRVNNMAGAYTSPNIHKTCASFCLTATVDFFNQRCIVTGYRISSQQPDPFFACLDQLAHRAQLTKIIIRARERDKDLFPQHGFVQEAANPYFFRGQPMSYFSKFLSGQRELTRDVETKDSFVKIARGKAAVPKLDGYRKLPHNFTLRQATDKDIPHLIKLYGQVFSSYPTPIHSDGYLATAMEERTAYFVVTKGRQGRIISAAAADIDQANLCAEVTDCATYPAYQGQKLMYHLVGRVEQACRSKGLRSLYTLARAQSPGMNIVFGRHDYHYGGRLIQNCHIAGGYEDMNLWFKKL